MFIAMLDTSGIAHGGTEFYAAGETEEQARTVLAQHYVDWTGNNDSDDMVGDDPYGDWDETNVLEMLAERWHLPTLTMETLPTAMNEWYGVFVIELQPGQCLTN